MDASAGPPDTLGTRTFFDQNMAEPVVIPTAGGMACVFSARCPTKESANEDAAAVIAVDPQSAVLVVADGLGGRAAGEHAARLAVAAVEDALREPSDQETRVRTAIITGFERANAAVLELGIGAATTLAVVEIRNGIARPYHVGDSMILIAGGRGRIKLQTTPHSPVGYGVEAGLIDEDEAMHHEHRHLVSNVIGTPDMHIAIGPPVTLARQDTVLLASDGLFDNLYCDRIVAALRRRNLRNAAADLVAAAQVRMHAGADGQPSKPDDLTFVAFRLA